MADLDPSLVAALAGRYRVEREVGRGGMATVYLATDERHGRRVAIKVLSPELAGLVSVDRFLREIRVMATLQHPHILPLFDSGEVDGLPYYVMPFVEGESLRQRMTRDRRLGVDEAIAITREVASAIDFAHRHGVVHRDIKPENILLSDGHALVADFGIARALLADPATSQKLTATGISLGTPGYMSPEQATGDRAVDARTDIYALGAVTHEMLAGEPPFSGPSMQAILAQVLTESPTPLTQRRRGIPPAVSAAVQKALAIEAADRFTSAADFARALSTGADVTGPVVDSAMPSRWSTRSKAAGVLVAAVVVVAVGVLLSGVPGRGGASAGPVRLAVVPFREVGSGVRAGFDAGLTAALRSDLATLPNVDVIAGASVDALRDSARSPRYVAQELGATHVLTGTIQWDQEAGGEARVRIVPELVIVARGVETARAGEPIIDRVEDLFQAQSRVAEQIARGLGVVVSADAALRLARPPTRSRAAYEAWLRSRIDAERETELLQQAVALDSTFALAWAALGLRTGLSYQQTLDPAIATLSREASARAMTLDSNLALSRLARAIYERHVARDFAEAVRQGEVGMRLAPGDVSIMHFTAAALWNARRIDEALALARRAAALDPRDPSAQARVATILIWQRALAEAEPATGRALQVSKRGIAFINIDSMLIPLERGDLPAVRAYLASLGPAMPATVAFAMREWHLGWTLDSAQFTAGLQVLRAANDGQAYHRALAQRAALARDPRLQLIHADSSARDAAERLQQLPQEERLRVALAFAHALAGRKREALAQVDTVSATRSAWKDGFQGAPISLAVAEIRAIAGDDAHAIALLDSLLKVPGFVTPDYLRIDPWFDGLRRDPRFRALARQ